MWNKMEIKHLFNKPKIIGLCADVNQGKSNTLYFLIDTVKGE